MASTWWVSTFLGVALLSVNRIGDGLRDLLDPSLRNLDQEHSG